MTPCFPPVANGVFLGNTTDMYNSLGVYTEPYTQAYNAMYIGMGLGLMAELRMKMHFSNKTFLLFGLLSMLCMNIIGATIDNPTLVVLACLLLGFTKVFALVEYPERTIQTICNPDKRSDEPPQKILRKFCQIQNPPYIYVTNYVITNKMKIFNEIGKVAMGSRLRMLTERMTEDASQIYKLFDIDMQPKWFPAFYALSKGEAKTITAIANEIGHTHPSVSKIISEMTKKGYVREKKDTDGRRTVVQLSATGMEITEKIKDQYIDINSAIEELSAQTRNDLWKAIEEWEFLLDQKTLLRRVQEKKKERESGKVTIIPYQPQYQDAFKALNEEWISTWFTMEEADHKALHNPQGYILDKGGHILMAFYEDTLVGTVALIKMDDPDYDFELAKMAVSPKARGKNIGYLLGTAILEKARSLGAKGIYLESNTILKPAINLYHKLGFQKVAGHPTPYTRCNIQMGLTIK